MKKRDCCCGYCFAYPVDCQKDLRRVASSGSTLSREGRNPQLQAKLKSKSVRDGRETAGARRMGGRASCMRRSVGSQSDGRWASDAATENRVAEAAIADTRTACVLEAAQLRTVGQESENKRMGNTRLMRPFVQSQFAPCSVDPRVLIKGRKRKRGKEQGC
jgi:hypothetical protein